MSRSSSTGDLVPKDITEILALQASKKKRGSSLGRAFSWFKGSKCKKSLSNGQTRSGGPCGRSGEISTAKQIHANSEASKGQKQDEQRKLTVHYTASQHYQENVFIEGSRPQYLEDLHTEAREGLKILQQEENKNGVDFQDDQTEPEEDTSSKERDESLETDSTAGHSVISASTVSAVSSHAVLTRQGSTFKPLNPVNRLDKTKRRSRRTTIMGIPQQVQRELDMARGTNLQQLPNRERDEDDSSGTVVIPTIDGELPSVNHEGARVHLQNIEVLQTSRDEEFLINHIHSVYQDELNRKLGLGACLTQRPKSLAVPGMTTSSFLHEPQGPVMSISPQATYLSKIIPNAILPAGIDIIEINNDHSRRSASTVSKSSLASASPASSRSGGGTNQGPLTASSNKSHSQSSETVVSNSSTISSKGRCLPTFSADSTKEVSELIPKDMSVTSSSSWKSSDSKDTNHIPDHKELGDAGDNVRNSHSFSRSLSVMKTKLPPAPPQRTFSLHHEKLKWRSRERVDIKDLKDIAPNDEQTCRGLSSSKDHQSTNNEKNSVHSSVLSSLRDFQTSVESSPLSPDQAFTGSHVGINNSAPKKTGECDENKFDRTLSPSSGYSSQSGTPTHSPKEVSPSSPGKRRAKPLKPERAGVQSSPVVSVSSSMTSLSSVTSDMVHQDIQRNTTPSETLKCSPLLTTVKNKVTPTHPNIALRELFNIPPPPKVKAPSPPPPETWIHNKRTLELLCGPGPNPHKLHQLQKQQKDSSISKNLNINSTQIHQQMIPKTQKTEEIKTATQVENKEAVKEQNESMSPQVHEQTMAEPPDVRHNGSPRLLHELESPETITEVNQIIRLQEKRTVEDQKEKGSQTLPTTKVPTIKVDQSMLSQTNCEVKTNAEIVSTSPPRNDETNERHLNHKPMKTLGIVVPDVNGISPPPSPPPEHHPPPPPIKKLSASSVSIPPSKEEDEQKLETEEQMTFLESSWPPPPPPMEESTDLLFEETDELDFPPPPPSFIHEPLSEISVNCHEESCEQQADTELVSSNASEMDSSPDQDSEMHIILQKRTLQNVMDNIQLDKPCNVSDFSVDQIGTENTTVASPKLSFLLPDELVQGEDSSEHASPNTPVDSNVPLAPPLPVENQSVVNLRSQCSLVNKDNRSKELLGRHKSTPIPKEDANIPLVTPSLLQMVRLRSVNVGEEQISNDHKPSAETTTNEDHSITSQATPQKPIRKSLALKSNSPAKSSPASATVPSMRLQEAIRMKTAAMSSSGVPAMLNLRVSSTSTASSPVQSPKTPDGCDLLKSPASTASFIFSKSTKKVIIETPSSPEVQASLKQSLAAEIMQVSDQAKMITNGTKKAIKVPPPVAKKPVHGTNPPNKTENATPDMTEILTNKQIMRVEVNGQSDPVHPAGQRAQSLGSKEQARSTETAC
ncbi:NHS-like protein 3 isoform X2 [Pseudorasbora parva]|uniref:NHS-like protein 3 isoform X2 n=1 Tax=Pseudorasbora parva TaxID=51549 RepID=UPI00351E5571